MWNIWYYYKVLSNIIAEFKNKTLYFSNLQSNLISHDNWGLWRVLLCIFYIFDLEKARKKRLKAHICDAYDILCCLLVKINYKNIYLILKAINMNSISDKPKSM